MKEIKSIQFNEWFPWSTIRDGGLQENLHTRETILPLENIQLVSGLTEVGVFPVTLKTLKPTTTTSIYSPQLKLSRNNYKHSRQQWSIKINGLEKSINRKKWWTTKDAIQSWNIRSTFVLDNHLQVVLVSTGAFPHLSFLYHIYHIFVR